MSTQVLVPESMAGGTLARWLKRVGDRVSIGEVLAEVETDKATMEIESPGAGTLVQVLVTEGASGLAANAVLALLEE
jgi:pyruvate dehydrogenase E1 component subunit beta